MNVFLLCLLMAVCLALIWLDVRGVSLSCLVSRLSLTRRIKRNLKLSWSACWRITGGRR
ncbi:MAG: hypothetical protein LBS89_09020 [Zoogloeaceae bacterium]|jgi:hypothetical protein|nr:hypothetical protein [Zoogloeaceae bacterium]